jgi:hypothetical protein
MKAKKLLPALLTRTLALIVVVSSALMVLSSAAYAGNAEVNARVELAPVPSAVNAGEVSAEANGHALINYVDDLGVWRVYGGVNNLAPHTSYEFRIGINQSAEPVCYVGTFITDSSGRASFSFTVVLTDQLANDYSIVRIVDPECNCAVMRASENGFTGLLQFASGIFPDVSSHHPYVSAIEDLASHGIVRGFVDGTFGPDKLVTRQQFAKMVVNTLGLNVTGSEMCPFADVLTQIGDDPFYPSKYVAVCAAHGITLGKTPTSFAPYDNITRQQLITMIVRAVNLSEPPADYTPPFSSGQFYPEEHYLNARKAAYAALLDGLQDIGPAYGFMSPATRGEVCALLYNLLHR